MDLVADPVEFTTRVALLLSPFLLFSLVGLGTCVIAVWRLDRINTSRRS